MSILALETKKYAIKIDNFEGPLDLLCHLIDKNKMNIYDIQISKITDQYIEYLKEQEKLNLEIASEFLVMASTLLYLKSKNLLPKQEEEEEELTEESQNIRNLKKLVKYLKKTMKYMLTEYLKDKKKSHYLKENQKKTLIMQLFLTYIKNQQKETV